MAIKHLSKSQISLYMECSLKYKFQYVDELPKPFKASALAFGGSVHSALEWLHKEKLKGVEVSFERFVRIFEADWYGQKIDTDLHFKNGDSWDSLRLKGKEILGLYFNDPIKKVVAAEYPFEVPLINPRTKEKLDIPLNGIIDVIEDGDIIGEFKTSARSMDEASVENNLQLTAYAYAYRFLFNKEAGGLKIINFVKNKTVKRETLKTSRGPEDFERLFNLSRMVLKGIRSQLFYPRYNFMCADCEYVPQCRAWQGH
jgi:putative RecB family exonuclease